MNTSVDLKSLPKAELSAILSQLEEIGYRFTTLFVSRADYTVVARPERILNALIYDIETTGMKFGHDKIIEVGMVLVEFCPESGRVFRVLDEYNALEDPGMPISAEATAVHGITDEDVKGKRIDDAVVERLAVQAHVVIAHNAKFDRPFSEERFPVFATKGWACSHTQVNWIEEGMGSSKLEFLAYRYGFHYVGHRAVNDCYALLEVLQRDLPGSGDLAMKRLLDGARRKDYGIWPLKTDFSKKDLMKDRDYRWNADAKVWVATVDQESLDSELEWIGANIYDGSPANIEVEVTDAFNRFSPRRGKVSSMMLNLPASEML